MNESYRKGNRLVVAQGYRGGRGRREVSVAIKGNRSLLAVRGMFCVLTASMSIIKVVMLY